MATVTSTATAPTYPMPEKLTGRPVRRNGEGWIDGGRGYTQFSVDRNGLHWTAVIWSNGMPFATVKYGRTPALALAEAFAQAGDGRAVAELAPVLIEDAEATRRRYGIA